MPCIVFLNHVCTVSGVFLFLAVAVFGGNCYRRDWLMYPAFNVLDWSYALAVIAFMLFGQYYFRQPNLTFNLSLRPNITYPAYHWVSLFENNQQIVPTKRLGENC